MHCSESHFLAKEVLDYLQLGITVFHSFCGTLSPRWRFFEVHCYFPLTHSAVWAHHHYSYQMPTSASPCGLRQPCSVHLVFIILVVHWLWVPHLMADEALCWPIALETSLSSTHSAWVWRSTVFWSCIVFPTTVCFCLGQLPCTPTNTLSVVGLHWGRMWFTCWHVSL